MFILRNKLEKQFAKINSWAVLLGSPNFAVRPGTSQNSPFHRGPVQSKKCVYFHINWLKKVFDSSAGLTDFF